MFVALAEAAPELEHLLHALVLGDVVALGQVAESLVHEHAGEVRVADHRVAAALHHLGAGGFHGVLGRLVEALFHAAEGVEVGAAAFTGAAARGGAVDAGDGAAAHAHVHGLAVEPGALAVGEVQVGVGIEVAQVGAGDAVVAEHALVVAAEQVDLVFQADIAGVGLQVELDHVLHRLNGRQHGFFHVGRRRRAGVAHGLVHPAFERVDIVESDEAPAAVHAGAHIAAEHVGFLHVL